MNYRPCKGHLLVVVYNNFGDTPFVYNDIKKMGISEVSWQTLLAWTRSDHLLKLQPELVEYTMNDHGERKEIHYTRYRNKYRLSNNAIKYCERYLST